MEELHLDLLNRWITGLRVGLVAHRLSLPPDQNDRSFRLTLREALARELSSLGAFSPDTNRKCSVLRSLPIQTLYALKSSTLERNLGIGLKAEVPAWRAALEFITTSQKEWRPPLVTASKLLAQLLLDGLCSPHFFMQCGRLFVSTYWKFAERDGAWDTGAKLALEKLRAKTSHRGQIVNSLARVSALNEFRILVSSRLQHWNLIENALYHQLFGWPLLVFDSKQPAIGAFSIPVALDVIFDGANAVDILGTDSSVDVTEWREELTNVVRVAKDLWRSKHGGLSLTFRDSVENVSVQFDFRLVQQIVTNLPIGLRLTDKSMGAYLAQLLLHRLLGRSNGFSSAITGQIGARRRWADGTYALDYEFDPVAAVPQKIRYVFASRLFSGLVLSAPRSETRNELIAKSDAYIEHVAGEPIEEINYCAYMSNVSDVVQVNGWRQHIYIRCPDIMYALHQRADTLPAPNAPDSVRCLLSASSDPILRVPADMSVSALLLYLRQVNFVEREALSPNTPPMLSWAFIRATEDENDRRFWQIIWRIIGAEQHDFTRFRHANTSTDAARLLADALNTFSPRESCPSHRAPDLLVIVGAKRLQPQDWMRDDLLDRSHLFPSVMAALAKEMLLQTPIEKMRTFIGRTRIIVVDHDEYDGDDNRAPTRPNLETREALERLSCFRYGFTQQMASTLLNELGYAGSSIRDYLRSLTHSGYLNEAGGQYWVRGNIGRTKVATSVASRKRAKWHWAAAKAFAPYLSVSAAPGLNFVEALLPENVHEASFHLEEAFHNVFNSIESPVLAGEHDNFPREIRLAHSRMLRFVELPSADLVEKMTRARYGLSSVAAWDMVAELLAEKYALDTQASPLELVTFARAGHRWLEKVLEDPAVDSSREDVAKKLTAMYTDALCATAGGARQDAQKRFGILTHYAHFLTILERMTGPSKTLEEVRQEINRMIEAGIESGDVEARWFETEGDRIQVPEGAVSCYRLATRLSPKYFSCWVKLAGARTEQTADISDVAKEFSDISFDMRGDIYRWGQKLRLPIKSDLDRPWVTTRWQSGLTVWKTLVHDKGALLTTMRGAALHADIQETGAVQRTSLRPLTDTSI